MNQRSRMLRRKRSRSPRVRSRVRSRTPSPLTPRHFSPRISPKIRRTSPIQDWEGGFILTPALEEVLRNLHNENNNNLNFSSKRKPKTPRYRDSLDEKRMKKLKTIPEERMSVIQRLTSSSFPTRIKKFFTPKKSMQRTLNNYKPYFN